MPRRVPRPLLLAALPLAAACAVGKVPPEPTEMVPVTEDLDFLFGAAEACYAIGSKGAENDPCTTDGISVQPTFPQLLVRLDPFEIDRHEVTNVQYRYCVSQGGCSDPQAENAIVDEQQDYYFNEQFGDFPVVQVTWKQAAEYCEFVGRRLPSEFEWERVAKGGGPVPRPFPAEGLVDIQDCQGPGSSLWPAALCRSVGALDAVDNAPKDFVLEGGEKIHHLFGNAAEWVSEWYRLDPTCDEPLPAGCIFRGTCSDQDEVCKQKSKTCASCAQDGGTANCHYVCAGKSKQYPTCVAYSDDDQPIHYLDERLQPGAGGSPGKIVRGGSVFDVEDQNCFFRSEFRDRPFDPEQKFGFLGFRCARTLE